MALVVFGGAGTRATDPARASAKDVCSQGATLAARAWCGRSLPDCGVAASHYGAGG
jgi:hypothetical protein